MAYGGMWYEIQLGTAGLLTDLPASSIPVTNLIKAVNVDFAPGYIQKAPGAITYNTTAFSAGVVALQDYWLDGVTQRMLVATADGKIWKDYGTRDFNHNTPIATGLGTLNNQCSFVIGGNEIAGNPKLVFFFNGGTQQIKVISGDSNQPLNITLPATDWPNATPSSNPSSYFPKFGLIHRARLWVFMKSTAYASNTTNHQDFQTAQSILINQVGPGEGGDITGAIVYKGTLLVFKQGDYVYQLVDTDSSSTNWYFKLFGTGIGIANWHANTQVLDDLLAISSTGTLTSYKATLNYGNFTQGDLYKTFKVSQYFKQHTTPAGIPFTQACFYPEKGKAFFTSRSGYKTYNDQLTVYDVSDPQMPKFCLWNHYQADTIALRRDLNNVLRPMYGGTNGYVYLGDRETRSIGGSSQTNQGTAYTGEFKTPYWDGRQLENFMPGITIKNKAFELLMVTFTPDGNHSLSIDVWIDGKFSETVTATMTIDTNYLGAFKLGSSTLGVEEEQSFQVPLHGTGRRISFRCYNSNLLESFKVSKLGVGFRVLGEEQTRLATP